MAPPLLGLVGSTLCERLGGRRFATPCDIAYSDSPAASRFLGRRTAAARPRNAMIASAPIASAYDPFPDTTSETKIVPAIAAPKEEPRLETLRESPEISPCVFPGSWTGLRSPTG